MSKAKAMKIEVTGQGDPIVLVPGGLTGWISWKPFAEELSTNFRVIRVQLLAVDLGIRGEALPSGYSVDSEVDALGAALDGIGVPPAHLVAWSYGAEVTLSLALKAPDRIRSLTLIEPPAVWVLRSLGLFSDELLEQQRQMQSMGPKEISEAQLEWFTHFAGFVPAGVDPRTLPQWPLWMEYRQSLRTGDAAFRHQDDIGKVRGFSKPVLLFKGEGSADFLLQIIDVLGQQFPYAKVEQLPGGHALHIASKDRFMKTLLAFLEQARRE